MKKIVLTATLALSGVCYAEDWEFISMKPGNDVGIKNVKKLSEGVFFFDVLKGYLPEGRDMGFPSRVASQSYALVYKCGGQEAQVAAMTINGMSGEVLREEIPEDGKVKLVVSDDAGIEMAANKVCGYAEGL